MAAREDLDDFLVVRAAVAEDDCFEQRGPAEVVDMVEVHAGQHHPPHVVDVASLAGGDR